MPVIDSFHGLSHYLSILSFVLSPICFPLAQNTKILITDCTCVLQCFLSWSFSQAHRKSTNTTWWARIHPTHFYTLHPHKVQTWVLESLLVHLDLEKHQNVRDKFLTSHELPQFAIPRTSFASVLGAILGSCIAHSCSTSTLQAEHLMGRNEGQPGGSDLSQGGPEFRYTPRNDIQPGKMGVTAMGYESPSKEDSRRCEVWAKLHNLSGLLHNCHFLCHYSWLMLEGWHRACIQLHVTGEGALAGQGVPRNVWLVHSQITFAIHKRPAANLLHNYQHTAITFSDFLLVGEKEEA